MTLALISLLASAKDLNAYRSTDDLVWDKAFHASVIRFFGSLRASYYWHDDLVSGQVIQGLGGPPDDVQRIPDSQLYFASACRHHSCMEKAAVVLANVETPIAFGIIYYPCAEIPARMNCNSYPNLLIFTKALPVEPHVRDTIVAWARGHVKALEAIAVHQVK